MGLRTMSNTKMAAGKTAKNAKGARAPRRNAPSRREISRLVRLQAEFEERKAALETVAESYPEALKAIDEYSNSFLAEGRRGRARRYACHISNDTACVGNDRWRPYAADALARYAVDGDQPGDALPFEVVAGLVHLRHNAPMFFSRLVRMDAALGAVLPLEGGSFPYSAILMRAALAAANAAGIAA